MGNKKVMRLDGQNADDRLTRRCTRAREVDFLPPSIVLEYLLLLPFPTVVKGDGLLWNTVDGCDYSSDDQQHRLYQYLSKSFFDGVGCGNYAEEELMLRKQLEGLLDDVRQKRGKPDYQELHLNKLKAEFDPGNLSLFHHEVYWNGGIALAYWCKETRIAFMLLEHQDKELPIMLILGVRDAEGTKTVHDDFR
jgi:hypothetical protein